MWPLYGDPAHRNPLFGHRWGYTPETLTVERERARFAAENVRVVRARHHFPGTDFRVEVSMPGDG